MMRIFPTPLAFFFLTVGFAYVPPVPAVSASCNIVARVMQSPAASHLKPGASLCEGQSIPSVSIRVACTSARKILWLQKTADLSQCGQSYPSVRRCSHSTNIFCNRMRGEISSKPLLVRPYGEMLSRTPSEIQWLPVQQADHYEVHVLGDKTQVFSSTQDSLKLPSITSTGTIEIIVEAFTQGRVLSTSTTTFNLLEPNEVQQVDADIDTIDRMQAPSNEKKSLKLSIYSHAGLLDDSIALVQKEILLHPNNPSNIRLLGDIYLESGLIDDANHNYQKSLEVASRNQDKAEINRSEWGLRQVLALRFQ